MMKISKSHYSDIYEYEIDEDIEVQKINEKINNSKKTVVVQGLGFVGSAMVAALSNVIDNDTGKSFYNVIGVDLADENNYWKIARANEGKPPVVSTDSNMDMAYENMLKNKNFIATYSKYAYNVADIVIIDVHLDINKKKIGNAYDYSFTYEFYKKAIEVVAKNVRENTLIMIETTVPPGSTEKVIYPIFQAGFKERNLDVSKIYLAHSYERVMPGKEYLNSIINYYRVFSGINDESKYQARIFLESFINTNKYPLSELHSTTASEMSKVLENSYRAMNIAFMQEWTEYAECANVNLFEIVNAIRVRPTHKNIMLPGFGVGGYCLTKDSLLADWSFNNLFEGRRHLDMSLNAININDLMPQHTLSLLQNELSNNTQIKNIALLGISYLNDVADTRYSPSELFYDECLQNNMNVYLHDPIVKYWEEKKININQDLSSFSNKGIDVVVLTVRHSEYLNFDINSFNSYFPNIRIVIDGFDIINDEFFEQLMNKGIKVIGVGKGHWKKNIRGNNNE